MVRYKHSDDAITAAVKKSNSVFDVLRALGIRLTGGSHVHIKRRIATLGLDTSHFNSGCCWNKSAISRNKRSSDEILVDRTLLRNNGRRAGAHVLKRALLEIGREYICSGSGCTINGEWIGNDLTLEIDHINSNWLDDRCENLQFLCPNCHAVKTKRNTVKKKEHRKRERKTNLCSACGNRITRRSTVCKKCVTRETKIVWPDISILIAAKNSRSVCKLSKSLGVSDVAIHKRIKRFLRRSPRR